MPPKYQPRFQMRAVVAHPRPVRAGVVGAVQAAARRASTSAYTRCGCAAETPRPMRPGLRGQAVAVSSRPGLPAVAGTCTARRRGRSRADTRSTAAGASATAPRTPCRVARARRPGRWRRCRHPCRACAASSGRRPSSGTRRALVGAVRVPERRDEHDVGIARIDQDAADLLGVGEPDGLPGVPGIARCGTCRSPCAMSERMSASPVPT